MTELNANITINAQGGAKKKIDELNAGMRSASQAAGLLAKEFSAFLTIQVGSFIKQQIVQLAAVADAYKLTQARIKLASGSVGEYVTAQRELFAIAQRTATPLNETAALYARVNQSILALGGTQRDTLDLTELVNQSFRISGASAASSAAGVTQLTQALASGVLRGDEFNSIMENSPRLAQALADGLKVPRGELRKLAEDGKLSADVVIQALLSQKEAIAEEFGQVPLTIGAALTQVSNAWQTFIGQVDASSGVTQGIAETISALATHLQALAEAAVRLAGVIGAVLIAAVVKWAAAMLAARQAQRAAAAASLEAQAALIAAAQAAVADTAAVLANTQARIANWEATILQSSAAVRMNQVFNFLVPLQAELTAATAAHTAAQHQLAAASARTAASVGLLSKALGVAVAAFAAWQLGAWLRDNVEVVRKFGVAMAAGLHELALRAKAGFEIMGEDIRLAFRAPLDFVKQRLADLALAFSNVFELLPAVGDDIAARLRSVAGALEPAGEAADAYRKKVAAINEQLGKDVARLREEYVALFAAADTAPGATAGGEKGKSRFVQVKAEAEAAFAVFKDALDRESKALDDALEHHRVSIQRFYEEKTLIAQRQIDAEIALRRKEIAEAQRLAADGKAQESERVGALAQVKKLSSEITVLERERLQAEIDNETAAADAAKRHSDELARLRDELLDLTGAATSEDRRAAIARQLEDFKKQLQAQGDTEGGNIVNRLVDVKSAKADLDALEAQFNAAMERMAAAEESLRIQREAGLITESQMRERVLDLHRQTAGEVEKLLPDMERLAGAIGPKEVTAVEQYKNKFAELKVVVNEVKTRVEGVFKDAFTGLFASFIDGTKSMKEAFADFVQSVQQGIARIIAEKFAERFYENTIGPIVDFFLDAIFPGKPSSSSARGNLLPGFTARQSGGLITGPGSGTSDSIPARLSNGEYVIRAAAVRRLGVGFLDALNNLRFGPPHQHAPKFGFAEGGLAVAGAGAGNVVVNLIEAPGRGGQVSQRQEGSQVTVDVMVEQIESVMGRRIQRGQGLAPTLEGKYGLNPAAGAVR